jgi:two-component system phosphate regulon sensor histidine kinase PhoR
MSSEDFSGEKACTLYRPQLFPRALFNPGNHLMVYFPEQRNLIYRSLGFMGLTSLSLTFIIIAIFVITLLVIFRQKKLSEMKNDFVNNMTHELKTPISTISLASQMLSDKSIPGENKNYDHISRIIDTESKRLSIQVEKVLQMAIFDRGKLKLRIKEVYFDELIANTIANFNIQVRKREGKMHWKPGCGDAKVKLDEVHFGNVISNLLDNAIKYSKASPVIELESYRRGNNLCLRVVDQGIGISKEDQKRIFEKFFRVSTGNVHNVKGFGLGLSYVKKIVDIHQGSINLKSEPGKGTAFEICIPAEQA